MKILLVIALLIPFTLHDTKIVPQESKKSTTPKYYSVKATMYTVSSGQTDTTPNITATGFRLDSINPKRHRIIAVSRDLKRILGFGKKVRIEGAGKWSGVYVIKDVMHKRWTRKIDILVNPSDRPISYNKVKLYPL